MTQHGPRIVAFALAKDSAQLVCHATCLSSRLTLPGRSYQEAPTSAVQLLPVKGLEIDIMISPRDDSHTGRNVGIALGVVAGCAVLAVIFLIVRKKHVFISLIPGIHGRDTADRFRNPGASSGAHTHRLEAMLANKDENGRPIRQ